MPGSLVISRNAISRGLPMVTRGLLVRIEAMPGKEADVELLAEPAIEKLNVLAAKLPG